MPQKIIKQSQKRRFRSWIILGKNLKTGEYSGITELLISMGLDPQRVRVETEWELLYYQKLDSEKRKRMTDCMNIFRDSVKKYNKNYPEYEFNLYRVGTPECPVKIDWGRYHRMKKDKFERRNPVFRVKA